MSQPWLLCTTLLIGGLSARQTVHAQEASARNLSSFIHLLAWRFQEEPASFDFQNGLNVNGRVDTIVSDLSAHALAK